MMKKELGKGRSPASQGRAATASQPSPSVSGIAGIPNAALRSPEAIWANACVGREGYCSSDLQAAAKGAILIAQMEALTFAAALAPYVRLPEGYQWSDSGLRKFQFGAKRMAEAIQNVALNTMKSAIASGIEGEAGDPKGLHPEGESPAPEGGDAR